ncbi:MAG: ABC transporter permease [Bacteroidales bacterium]
MRAGTFTQDVRIGLRVLLKDRAFSALAILVIALGICTVSTQFALVNGVMLRGFSFPNADRLVSVNFVDPSSATVFGVNGRVLSMDFEEVLPEQKSFERMAGFLSGSTVNMTVNGEPRRYTGAYTTPEFFRILGVGPLLGRDFTAADNRPGAEKVAIIGYGLWQRDFAGSKDVIGKTVRLNGKPATIVGVMPQGFVFPSTEELWIPLYSEFPVRPRNDPQASAPSVLGLIRSGVSLERAQAEFTGFAKRLAAAYPDTNKVFDAARVEPLLKSFSNPALTGTLLTMLAFCVGVLLIACVNVMNMQFARATLRARELAVRSALGATRARLMRQMLTESTLLAGIGAVAGIGLAYLSADWLSATLHTMENAPPAWMVFEVDRGVVAFAVAATVVAALVSGLLPAWMAARARVSEVLREGGRGSTSRAINVITRGLVVAQIVVTCVLLIGALLQVRSIVNQQRIDYGYDTDGIMSARLGLMDGDYPTPESRRMFYDRLLVELRNSAQYEAAALTSRMRMTFSNSGPIEIDGRVYREKRDRPNANFEQVSPGYFEALGQKVLEGRPLADDDADSKQPVAVVNATFATRHFGRESAVGRRFRTGDGSGAYGPWRTIVGVVSTVRMQPPFSIPNVDDSGFYVPFYALPFGPVPDTAVANQFATVIVRPRGGVPAESLVNGLRRTVTKVDANLPLYFVGTPKSHIEASLAAVRIIATMFTLFGIIATLLAAVGIYGVMSFAVNQRRQEFGVRMALGADTTRILAMVLKQGGRQLVVGLLLGLPLSLAVCILGRDAIGSMLYNVSTVDPVTYGGVVVLVVVVSAIAVLVPARRATRVDPMITLRAE